MRTMDVPTCSVVDSANPGNGSNRAGVDRLTLTFAVEDVDFSIGLDNPTQPVWRSFATDYKLEYWNQVAEGQADDLDWEPGAAAGQEPDGEQPNVNGEQSPVGLAPVPTGCWRDLHFGGMRVHVSVYERQDIVAWTNRGWLETERRGEDSRGRRWWATVSFNPARFHDPHGWAVCPAAKAQTVACAVVVHLARTGVVVPACEHIEEASSEAVALTGAVYSKTSGELIRRQSEPTGRSWCQDMTCLLKNVFVSRLDATMDFQGVLSTELWVDVLCGHRQPGARGWKQRYGPVSASARRGENGLRVAVYDKHVQAEAIRAPKSALAPEGTLRVEVRARSRKLEKIMGGSRVAVDRGAVRAAAPESRRLENLTPALVGELFMEGFVWAGLDRWIGGQHPLDPSRLAQFTKATASRLRAFLDERAHGRPATEVVDNTTRRYEKLASKYGYIVGIARADVFGPVRHLNVASGVEGKPSVEWRRKHALTGVKSGASQTVVTRRHPRSPRRERGVHLWPRRR